MLTESDLQKISRNFFSAEFGASTFVEQVLRHLTYALAPDAARGRAEEAAGSIAALVEGDSGEVLLDDPELFASMFQNADLLDARDPGSASLLSAVMSALGAAE